MTDTPDDDDSLTDAGNGMLVGKINPDDYYMLDAQSADWQWLLSAAIVKEKLSEADPKAGTVPAAFIRMQEGDKFPKFFIKKSALSAEKLAQILGFKGEPQALATTDVIHLKPIGDQSKWEKPTVPYAGAA